MQSPAFLFYTSPWRYHVFCIVDSGKGRGKECHALWRLSYTGSFCSWGVMRDFFECPVFCCKKETEQVKKIWYRSKANFVYFVLQQLSRNYNFPNLFMGNSRFGQMSGFQKKFWEKKGNE